MTNQADFDRVEKLMGKDGLAKLQNATVAIVGVGTLGSKTVVELASAGVGNFILVDPDTVKSHNCVRSAYDLRYVGWKKVLACQDLIRYRNPNAVVTSLSEDVFMVAEKLKNADLVIVAGLGSELATGKLALLLRDMKKTVLYAGVYEKAIAGDIFVVDPSYDGPCYHCFASQVSDSRPETKGNVNYGMAPDELKAQPGLGTDVAFVASALAKWVLRIIINDPDTVGSTPGNYLILANNRHNIGVDTETGKPVYMQPSTGRWFTLPKVSRCNICGLVSPQVPTNVSDIL